MNINIYEAKSQLSKLISLLLEKKEEEIVICRNGNPVVSMKAYNPKSKVRRIGIAKGKLLSLSQEEFDSFTIDDLFEGKE